jgi:hypothetical protein
MKRTFLFFFLLINQASFAQNIGIGVVNPVRAKLELNGAVDATSAIFGGESSGISVQRNWPGIGFNEYYNGGHKYMTSGYAALQYLDPTTGNLALDISGFGTAGNNFTSVARAFNINSTGNLGIRSNAFTSSLFVAKSGNVDGSAVFGGTSYNSHFNYGVNEDTYIRGGRNGSLVVLNDIPGSNVILGAGNNMVGINVANPTYTLEISQTGNKGMILLDPLISFNRWEYRVNLYLTPPASHLRTYYNDAAVGAFFPTGGYTGTVSDRRIKSNIRTLPALLDKFNRLNPVEYEMKDYNSSHERTFGLIAQEVKTLFPVLVPVKHVIVDSVNLIPDLHALDYTSLSVISIKVLQEQFKQIQILQAETEALMKRLEELDRKVQKRY